MKSLIRKKNKETMTSKECFLMSKECEDINITTADCIHIITSSTKQQSKKAFHGSDNRKSFAHHSSHYIDDFISLTLKHRQRLKQWT